MNLSGGTTRSRTTTDSSSSKDGVDPISPTTYAPGTLPRHDRLTSNNSVSSPTFSETQPNRQDLPPKPPRLTAGISITETPSKPSTPVSLRSLPPVPNGVGPEKKPNAYDHLKEMWSGPHRN